MIASRFPGLSVAVLNLARRRDRLLRFVDRWNRTGYRLPTVAFAAIDDPARPDLGCLATHQMVLRVVQGPLLVFEDDACFAPEFTLTLRPPPQWEVLWLGGQHREPPQPYDDEWVIPTDLVRTHAYIARDPQRLAGMLTGLPRLDPYMAALPSRQYVLRHQTVGQVASTSDIDGSTRDTDEYWWLPQ